MCIELYWRPTSAELSGAWVFMVLLKFVSSLQTFWPMFLIDVGYLLPGHCLFHPGACFCSLHVLIVRMFIRSVSCLIFLFLVLSVHYR